MGSILLEKALAHVLIKKCKKNKVKTGLFENNRNVIINLVEPS
jgi:hypothetical protein